jgi:peptide/nickel transport system substrate-binding protein
MLALAMVASAGLSACSSSTRAVPGGRPVQGGTAYFAEPPQETPTYIFPLVSGEFFTGENTSDLQTLLYQPLYWYGDRGSTAIDYRLSIGDQPVYTNGGRVVTIHLKHYVWSDGETLSARDVGLWINLLKANKAQWASYVPGGFPDNVLSWKALSPTTVQLNLNGTYNPFWFTYNELSQITPLPIAWDRTSLTANTPSPAAAALPDTSVAGAKAVYAFLNSQATKVASYASNPIWSVVDGPWRLADLTSDGTATFMPNRRYTGPQKPHLARFVELPFTSATAEFLGLRAGQARGGPGSSGEQISVGYVPDNDLPQAAALHTQGYQLIKSSPFGFNYFEPNFNNPKIGPIFRQLYFRQAFEHLVNQPGWIHAYYNGLGVPTYSPVPAGPPNPYSDTHASVNPYPFSLSQARAILTAHGWHVVPNGLTTCTHPGTTASECGPGIRAGEPLSFSLMYPSGLPYTDGSMTDLQSVAKQVGIQIALDEVTAATIAATIEPCASSSPACKWEIGQYGGAWLFEPDHYPSGDEIFQTGALGNVNNYSDPAIDKLIRATTTNSAATSQAALNAYADKVRLELPDFWQPSPVILDGVQGNLHGDVPNAYNSINPEEWYFTKG